VCGPGPTSEELAEIKRLRVEVRDLKEVNETHKADSIFSPGSSTLATVDLRSLIASVFNKRHCNTVSGSEVSSVASSRP